MELWVNFCPPFLISIENYFYFCIFYGELKYFSLSASKAIMIIDSGAALLSFQSLTSCVSLDKLLSLYLSFLFCKMEIILFLP